MATSKEQRIVEIIINGQQANASLKEMNAAAAVMWNQLQKMSKDDPGRAQLNKDFLQLKNTINATKAEMLGMSKASGFMSQAWSTALGVFMGGGIQQVFTSIIGWFKEASTEAKGFEKALSSLSALTGLAGDDLQYLADQSEKTGDKLHMSAEAVLNAYKVMGSAKPELLGNKEALAAITEQAIILSRAAEMELGPASTALAESLNQFGEGADQAGRYINVMAAGAKEGASEINETAAALKNSGTVAAAANISFEATNAVIQSLSTVAIKGGEAGTGLKNVLLTLQSGADEFNPKVVGLEKALSNLGKQNLSTAELAKMFGKENVVVAQHMVNNRGEIERLTKAMTGTNTAYEQAATNMDNLEGDMQSLDSATASLKITIGNGLNVVIREGVQFLTTLVLALKEAPQFIRENWDAISLLAVAVVTLNANNIRAAASTLAMEVAEKRRTIATRASAAAQWVINAAMNANPIGLVIAAVAALAGGFMLLYNRSEAVRGGVAGVWNAFKELLSIAGDIVSFLVNPIKNAGKIKEIMNAGDRLGKAFSDGYHGKIAEERAKQEKTDQAKHEQNKTVAKTKGQELGKATGDGFAASLKGLSIQALKDMLENETDKTHKSLIRKQIAHLKEKEKLQNQELKQEEKHQKELEKANEKFLKTSQQSDLEFQQLKIDMMQDGIDKVLAKLRLQHSKELLELEKHKKDVLANIGATESEKQALLASIEEQKKMKEAELRQAEEEATKTEAKKLRDDYFKGLEEKQALEAEYTENEFLQKQANFDGQVVRTIEAEQARDLALLEQKEATAQLKLASLERSGQGESAQALKLKNEILRYDNERTTKLRDNEEKLTKVKNDLARMQITKAQEALQVGIDLLGKDTAARKVAVTAHKAFSIGKIAIDLREEIQAIWKHANENPINAIIPGSGNVIAGVQTALAVGRAIKSTKEVTAQQFYGGGMTKKDGNPALIKMMERNGIWEMASGQTGGRIGTFAEGGMVNDARLGLIGEKGAELVIPNWMIKSPKYANTVAYLEAERQKGITAFATGGPTREESLSTGRIEAENSAITPFEQAMLAELKQMKEEIIKWPKTLQVHNNVGDTQEKIQLLNEIREMSQA
ncbi:phage tail tape measure protein [Adhaeribacter arboris]|uniref:Phage tail tape measure protein n=1 Tax=Adhaeribacter arboris TaxID=2072846 RepID=A0A2T2YEI6_9BACT|nr:phage tail tape measure protein [Adhaeribacter arboris]PSR53931.1 phage tail tape measure protein [Adhaeribacter arboris]